MSEMKNTIELIPTPYNNIEKYVSAKFVCKTCNGNGGWKEQVSRYEYEKKTCDICGGTGLIVADITITWRGVEENKNNNLKI